jgi:multiple sugar transport system substrate-binding protein
VQNGGQPGHRSAWTDDEANRITNNFFRNTLPALERAYLRPRYDGYIGFQDSASPVVHEFLKSGGNPGAVIQELQSLYLSSRRDRNGPST